MQLHLLLPAATASKHGSHSDEDVEGVHVNAHTPGKEDTRRLLGESSVIKHVFDCYVEECL